MRNPAFKRKVIEENGACCANCGSAEAIEYHHIVPVLLGGTNRITNIIPLCHRCHEAAHRGRHIAEYRNLKRTGRKTKLSDEEAFKVFDLYIDGQIGNKRCRELFGYKGTIITRTQRGHCCSEQSGQVQGRLSGRRNRIHRQQTRDNLLQRYRRERRGIQATGNSRELPSLEENRVKHTSEK